MSCRATEYCYLKYTWIIWETLETSNKFSTRNSGDLRTHSRGIFLSLTELSSFTVRYINKIILALEQRACINSEKFQKLSYLLALIQVGLIFWGGRSETSVVSEWSCL